MNTNEKIVHLYCKGICPRCGGEVNEENYSILAHNNKKTFEYFFPEGWAEKYKGMLIEVCPDCEQALRKKGCKFWISPTQRRFKSLKEKFKRWDDPSKFSIKKTWEEENLFEAKKFALSAGIRYLIIERDDSDDDVSLTDARFPGYSHSILLKLKQRRNFYGWLRCFEKGKNRRFKKTWEKFLL